MSGLCGAGAERSPNRNRISYDSGKSLYLVTKILTIDIRYEVIEQFVSIDRTVSDDLAAECEYTSTDILIVYCIIRSL